jgi:hypothetical protein
MERSTTEATGSAIAKFTSRLVWEHANTTAIYIIYLISLISGDHHLASALGTAKSVFTNRSIPPLWALESPEKVVSSEVADSR